VKGRGGEGVLALKGWSVDPDSTDSYDTQIQILIEAAVAIQS
jgi:hypothetical protein